MIIVALVVHVTITMVSRARVVHRKQATTPAETNNLPEGQTHIARDADGRFGMEQSRHVKERQTVQNRQKYRHITTRVNV